MIYIYIYIYIASHTSVLKTMIMYVGKDIREEAVLILRST
jgi:hypothetical protein